MMHRINSPLGPMVMREEQGQLSGLWFEGQKYFPTQEVLAAQQDKGFAQPTPLALQLQAEIDRYFEAGTAAFSVPLLLHGTPFQQAVWQAMQSIPCGQTTTYGALTALLAEKGFCSPKAVRAVGSAIGRNPILLIMPCHRVLGHNGQLTGYAGGLDKKVALLKLEGIQK